MPHSGGRVGAGIYLADQHTKSAGYTQGVRMARILIWPFRTLGAA